MALIPIRNKDRIVGLIHLNDRRKECFTLTAIELLEGIASHIGAALMRKRAEEALERLATYDLLTGLLNRRAILARLAQEISRARREGGHLSVGMLDIDHFKSVNDTYGHQVGDEVLIAFAGRVQAQLRGYDCVGRYGGEEFLVITPVVAADAGGVLYERLRASVADGPIETKAGAVSITVSIGVVSGTGQSTIDALLASADAALYRAKAEGRNRVASASPVEAARDAASGGGT
jgi:diguanylate cyclase (GGDEF)-like protein